MTDRVLELRRTSEGVRIVGDVPEDHVLTSRFIAREIESGFAEVTITLHPYDSDPIEYKMVGFDALVPEDEDDERVSYTSWKVERTGGVE